MEQGNKIVLVSMVNKDVYYLADEDADTLVRYIASGDKFRVFQTRDARSGATIYLVLSQISSIVNKGDNRG